MNDQVKAYTFCHFCGTEYASSNYPFHCQSKSCGQKVWLNPLPVVVVAIPVFERGDFENSEGYTYHTQIGYLGHVRNIKPGFGKLSLASGYVERHETWEAAAIREVHEEFGLTIKWVTLEKLVSVDGFLCILTRGQQVFSDEINWDYTNEETQKLVLFRDEKNEPNPYQDVAFSVQRDFLLSLHLPFDIPWAT